MKKLLILLVPVLALLFVYSGTLTAQDQSTQVVFISSQRVLAAHPAGQEAARLQEQALEEIGSIEEEMRAAIGTAQTLQELSPEQRERFDVLQRTLESVQQRWQAEISAAAQPAIDAVQAAIETVAQENGYTIVLDGDVAGLSGISLVVYAQEGLDITEQVIERIR